MNRKFTGNVLLFGIILSLTAVSCLDIKSEDIYTPEREQLLISEYLKGLTNAGRTVSATPLGVRYFIKQEGEGEFPEAGDTLSVVYVGYLITGEVFDASYYLPGDTVFHFIYKETDLIPGWDDMMAYLNKGRVAEFLVPSELAYGATGTGIIPPYTSLVFVAKMLNIRFSDDE